MTNHTLVINATKTTFFISGAERAASDPVTQCMNKEGCRECYTENLEDEVFVIPGDYYVIAMIPVYCGGDIPTSCGSMRNDSTMQLVEAVRFVIQQANTKRGQFGGSDLFAGRKLGALIVNSCCKGFRAEGRLFDIFTNCDTIGSQNISCKRVRQNIIGVIGGLSSSVSIRMSAMLQDLNFVLVSYASTSPELSNREAYSNFIRTCDDDKNQARAMLDIMKSYGWQYASILYVDDPYGRGGKDKLLEMASEYDICFTKPLSLVPGSNYNVLETLRKTPSAKVVIVFVSTVVAAELIRTVNEDLKPGEFIFIGSEAWGSRRSVIQFSSKLEGSITVSLALPNDKKFNLYLSKLHPNLTDELNPWLKIYWERLFGCHFPGSFNQTSGVVCERNVGLSNYSLYEQDLYAPYLINAAYALIKGANKHYNNECGSAVTTGRPICEKFGTNWKILWEIIINDTFVNNGDNTRVFDNKGNGNFGYRIHSIQENPHDRSKLTYIDVSNSIQVLLSNI